MSYEMVQVIILVKYNIKTHEIIRIKHNNGKAENDIGTNTHINNIEILNKKTRTLTWTYHEFDNQFEESTLNTFELEFIEIFYIN